jgi:two-component system C4-dicarboxylate transport sensor histidine kinase DctB
MKFVTGRVRNVWKRLLLLVGFIFFILWANLAAAIYLLWDAQRNYRTLVDTEVPRLVLVGELSRYSADLAALATSVLSGQAGEDAFVAETSAIDDGLRTILDTEGTAGQNAFNLIGGDTLGRTLREVLDAAQSQLDWSDRIDAQVDTLRWLNVDIQDEVEPVLRDLDYNIASRMLELQQADAADTRQALAEVIAEERARRDIFAEIGSDAATAMTLVVQVAVAEEAERVGQLETLLHDFRARLSERLMALPDASELVTLRQSIDRLFALFEGESSLIEHRLRWIGSRDRAYDAISATLAEIDAIQMRLGELSGAERKEVLGRIEASAIRIKSMAIWLIGATSLVVAIGALGIDKLIRTRIIVPLRSLSDRLMATAEARSGPQGGDDLERLTFAVGEFQRAITERDNAIADLRRTQADLVQAGKMAALGALSAGISHEINQPLGAISYRMSLLEQAAKAKDLPEVIRQAELVTALSVRIQRIIQHLRRFARRGKFERGTLLLGDVVANAEKLLNPRLRETGVTLDCDPSLQTARVTGDPILTEQVVLNVLTNAIDAVVDLGPEATADRRRIGVAAVADSQVWILVMTDAGVGLGDLDSDAAMMPFVSTKEAGRGMGLGLSISYNIARDMGGDLTLAPRQDAPGTVARFRLPMASEEDSLV